MSRGDKVSRSVKFFAPNRDWIVPSWVNKDNCLHCWGLKAAPLERSIKKHDGAAGDACR